MKVVTIALVVAALIATEAGAYELCDVPGKMEEFYRDIRSLGSLLHDKKFQELDERMNAMLAAHAAGKMSDDLVHRAFWRYFAKGDVSLEPVLREWIDAYPKSQAARLALAYHLTSRGWAARGNKFAYETSRQQFGVMEQNFRQALKVYDEADALGKKPTLSIAQRIWISRTTPLGLDADQLYRDAIKAWPDTFIVRIRYLEVSDPKWGGSLEKMQSVVDDVKGMPAADRRYVEYVAYRDIANAYWCIEGGCGPVEKRTGKYAKQVIAYFEKSIPLCPGFDDSLEGLMSYYQERKDWAAMIASASRLIERHPRRGFAFGRRGWAYDNSHKLKEALADYERATELGDGFGAVRLGWFYESGIVVTKDVRKAIDLYMIADMRKFEGGRKEAERLSKASGIPLK